MTPEQQTQLRAPFPAEEVGKLPRVTCRDCSDRSKNCQVHKKQKCNTCGNYISTAHIHLDYVGHAELTDRLLQVDQGWNWEPVGWAPDGMPATVKQGNNLVMWGRLTIGGLTRLGVGTAAAGKDDVYKELIGDFLRNAAMRFGVALDLWRKSEKVEADVEHGTEEPDPLDLARGTLQRQIKALPTVEREAVRAWLADHDFPPKIGQMGLAHIEKITTEFFADPIRPFEEPADA